MPTTQKNVEPVSEDAGELHFLIDMPGFALVRQPEDGSMEYSWAPSTCPADFVAGVLSTLDLREDKIWGDPNGVLFASLVNREELGAED